MTKLTDFTFKELTFLSLRMEDVQKDAQSKIELIQQFENSTIKDDLLEFHQEAYEMASLWRTQAQIAQISVKKDEIARSN